ncbi:TorD/DmsD family molecular chaperone [Noviherbaspirillum pedocola]|uniref:Molecular chaperone TorD family protein n=1 Tax=Noviherbaspirillum pedocola TaxID=2801341 RepID=A0A934W5Y9_9BURK|nr:molecular chaperone TorD family protein [Noviherbaspirillum pedocola]MBK4734500.1 molecular chaperone TorD family protein [Noviherbaspirillum pedocola]
MSTPLKFETPDNGEETARADLYGLLATLYAAPPSQALLDTIGSAAAEGEGILQQAWADLVKACRGARAEALSTEYDSLFIGVGKPEVLLYGSYYLAGFLMEKPLAELRADLARLGLERADDISEPEDHIAMLFEVMRYLIASQDIEHASIPTQQAFFSTHIAPWAAQLFDAIDTHRHAAFYATVTRLARAFIDVETQAFDMA